MISWFFLIIKYESSRGWYFLNAWFFFIKYTISQKMGEIRYKLLKYELFSELIFIKWGFFFHKCIIILLKIGKIRGFVPLNVEKNFHLRMTFFKWAILFSWMRTFFASGISWNQQKLWLTVKIWIFLMIDTLEWTIFFFFFFFTNRLLFLR